MSTVPSHPRRGLTVLELMLALTITAMVGAGIAGMLGVVTAGVSSSRDNRSVMIRAHAAQSRLGAYIGRSRCILDVNDTGENVTLWLEDSRRSSTVHATEVRWLLHDDEADAIDVYFVSFPDTWTQAARDLADHEYAPSANWDSVLAEYENAGHVASVRLIDGVSAVSVSLDAPNSLDSRTVTYVLGFRTEQGADDIPVTATIRHYLEPVTP